MVTLLGTGWVSYRILPLFLLISLIITLGVYSYRSGSKYSWSPLLLVTVGPAMFGLIVFRPEIFLITGAVFSFFIFRNLMSWPNRWQLVFATFITMLIFSILIYSHPKSLYLAPFYMLGYYYASRSVDTGRLRLLYLFSCVLLTVAIALSAVKMYNLQALSCPEYPKMMESLNKRALNPLDLISSPSQFVESLKTLSGKELNIRALEQISFREQSDINYLPEVVSKVLQQYHHSYPSYYRTSRTQYPYLLQVYLYKMDF